MWAVICVKCKLDYARYISAHTSHDRQTICERKRSLHVQKQHVCCEKLICARWYIVLFASHTLRATLACACRHRSCIWRMDFESVCVCVCVYVHMYAYIYIHMYIYTYIHIYKHLCTYIHTHTHIYVWVICIYVSVHSHIYIYIWVCVDAFVSVYLSVWLLYVRTEMEFTCQEHALGLHFPQTVQAQRL